MNLVTYNDVDPEVDAATLLPHHRKDFHPDHIELQRKVVMT